MVFIKYLSSRKYSINNCNQQVCLYKNFRLIIGKRYWSLKYVAGRNHKSLINSALLRNVLYYIIEANMFILQLSTVYYKILFKSYKIWGIKGLECEIRIISISNKRNILKNNIEKVLTMMKLIISNNMQLSKFRSIAPIRR